MEKFGLRNPSVSCNANDVVPMYCDNLTIQRHEKNLVQLFDMNFGKDWRYMINLFYWKRYGKHHIVFANPHELEEGREYYEIKRKGYYARAKAIIENYFSKGFRAVVEMIEQDELRMLWAFSKDGPKEILVTSKIFDAVNAKKQVKDADYYSREIGKIEDRYMELKDREISGDLSYFEEIEFKELNSKRVYLQKKYDEVVLKQEYSVESKGSDYSRSLLFDNYDFSEEEVSNVNLEVTSEEES